MAARNDDFSSAVSDLTFASRFPIDGSFAHDGTRPQRIISASVTPFRSRTTRMSELGGIFQRGACSGSSVIPKRSSWRASGRVKPKRPHILEGWAMGDGGWEMKHRRLSIGSSGTGSTGLFPHHPSPIGHPDSLAFPAQQPIHNPLLALRQPARGGHDHREDCRPMTRRYEAVYIFDSTLEDTAINEKINRFHGLLQSPDQISVD